MEEEDDRVGAPENHLENDDQAHDSENEAEPDLKQAKKGQQENPD